MVKKKFIYLPIEIKAREFWPKLWLASRLVKKNFVCILGDKPGVHFMMSLYPKGIYFNKSISQHLTKRLLQLVNSGQVLVCQDEEAGIARDDVETFFKTRLSEENIRLTSRFYCWGQNDYEYLLTSYSNYANHFRLTGSPRIDLWRPEICNKIYKDEIANHRSNYGSFVLINSAFGSTSKAEVEKRLVQALAYGNISEENFEEVKKDRLKRLEDFYSFVDMIQVISKNRPHQTFVVRPHPSENIADWKKLIKNQAPANLFLVREGDVTPWIAGCKALIHEGCTTGMQGVLMGKPVISFKPGNQDNNCVQLNNFPNTISYNTATVDELMKALDIVDNGWNFGSHDFQKKLDQLKYRIANLNEQYAAEQIADDLAALNLTPFSHFSARKALYHMRYREIVRKALSKIIYGKPRQNTIKREQNRPNLAPRTIGEKIPGGIQENEVKAFMKNLEQVDGEIKNIQINKLSDNVFEFYM